MSFIRTFTFLSFLMFLSCSQQEYADLILYNAKVVTLDESTPEAEAIAIKGNRILALGNSAEIKGLANASTRSVDLGGALTIPGIIDAHAHLMNLGRLRLNLDLSSAKTWDEAVAMVGAAAKDREPGSWILGRGWHQEKWAELPAETVDGYPLHHTLSAVTPNNPVFLTNSNGHAAFVNARAMELVGITASTPDPAGGQILRDASGNATGVFLEEAETLFYPALDAEKQQNPEAYKRRETRAVKLAAEECLRKGITSMHEAGMLWDTIDLLKDLAEKGELPIRVWGMIGS
ncbi:MAG: amidohydrolase family protein, partial [Calditrichota bacterium]